ncbi:hypothetical protein [Rhodopila sp.]|uniref:hypothetical protein n=1 Tax=Rhodopila sp. TaxID=2480087 RepID=UPI003D0E6607
MIDTRTKQRLIHIPIREIVCDRDEAANDALLLIHWTGGRHTEVRVPRVKTGRYPSDMVPSVEEHRAFAVHFAVDQRQAPGARDRGTRFISISSREISIAASSRNRFHSHFSCRLRIARSLAPRSTLSANTPGSTS